MAVSMLKATISIILQGKEFDFTSFPHVVGTLNSMSFLHLVFLVPAYTTKALLSRPVCVSNYSERKRKQIK